MYEPSKHLKSFHIAGFQHHDGALVLDQLKVGAKLEMVPERDNPHDPEAVALYFADVMLGYVPRDDNGLISLLAYYGHSDVFEARVLQVNPEADPWKQVRVGVYVADKR